MKKMPLAVLAVLAVALVSAACSSSSAPPPPCNDNPWECASGQTCWPKDAQNFACLNSGPGKAGDACQTSLDSPTCGDGLACLQISTAPGRCTPYCDPTSTAHACPAGQICQLVALGGPGGPQFHACYGGGTTADSGTD
jgi:hypothetical protein